MDYLWQRPLWPLFRWDQERVNPLLTEVRHQQGQLLGAMSMLGFSVRQEALLRTLTEEAQKTSEIEGELLSPASLRSSVARKLGIDIGGLSPVDLSVDGVVELMLDATQNHEAPLGHERLFGWHAGLIPSGRSGIHRIRVGTWRDDLEGPMRVISGPMGKEKIHFEAPPAARVPQEMRGFLDWFNLGGPSEGGSLLDPVLKSAIAHLWFVTIHPFDDGNGRLARAIADMALARADRSTERYYSVSKEICQERKSYYAILEATQKGDLDISAWLSWYLGCVGRAISCAQGELLGARKRAEFWEGIGSASLNLRQKEMLRRLLDGFDGRLTTAKWAALCGCSQDTAGRDISALVEAGILRKGEGGGRSSWYELPALSEA